MFNALPTRLLIPLSFLNYALTLRRSLKSGDVLEKVSKICRSRSLQKSLINVCDLGAKCEKTITYLSVKETTVNLTLVIILFSYYVSNL